MNWLGAVPEWCWWLIALVLVAGGQQYRVVVAQGETAEARTELSDYRLEVAERDRRAAAQARTEEHRIADAQQEARVKGHEERTIADAGAAGADAAGQRLRNDASHLAAAVSCSGTDTAAVARGEAATRAAMVLSELLDRSVATNRELAQAYDLARIAGQQCETEHDAVMLVN
ncbi:MULTISPECIES: DUF2514 domain-containing protein [Pseudomonas]|uniref:DUF2514 domain-containing protein n=1 Tax=Pseudomonas TaxID=286 RepID=UPI00224952B9|nr:DUF2514 domain-containing protein [Pseudomonas sp. DCB_BG]MCX2706037.1 DUF2514 domain-containing protein [Pseudomonas sp. DCB_BG]